MRDHDAEAARQAMHDHLVKTQLAQRLEEQEEAAD